jgi:phosphatidate cytidylyltransferase
MTPDKMFQEPVWIGILGIYLILIFAWIAIFALGRRNPAKDLEELTSRTRTWFWIVLTLTVVLAIGDKAAIIFVGFVSFLALKEFLTLIPTRRSDRRVLFWAYLAIPIQFWWVYAGYYGFFIIFIPVYGFTLLAFRMLLTGRTEGFIKAVGTLQWGLMLTVFNLSHLAFLFVLPLQEPTQSGGTGLFFFVIFLTQFNDVAQYVWGKMFGKRRITPTVSPGKTWEGFLGGIATTTILSILIAGYFTPFNLWHAASVGMLIGILGFVGDVTVSAVKRDLGVKDSGQFLPGHGGVLDRLDSLTFTAPLFLHFTRYFYG